MRKGKTKYRSSCYGKSLETTQRVYMVLGSDFFTNPEFEQMKNQKKSWVQLSGQTNPFCFEVSYQILGVNNRQKFSKFLLLTRCILF